MVLAASDVLVAQNIAFGIIAATMIVAALRVVTTSNVVHAALWLVVVLAGAAAQFILVASEFVAWVQVLIYIGAIVILFLFGIMLTRAPMRSESSLDNSQRWASAVVSLFLFGVLAALLIDAYGSKEITLDKEHDLAHRRDLAMLRGEAKLWDEKKQRADMAAAIDSSRLAGVGLSNPNLDDRIGDVEHLNLTPEDLDWINARGRLEKPVTFTRKNNNSGKITDQFDVTFLFTT